MVLLLVLLMVMAMATVTVVLLVATVTPVVVPHAALVGIAHSWPARACLGSSPADSGHTGGRDWTQRTSRMLCRNPGGKERTGVFDSGEGVVPQMNCVGTAVVIMMTKLGVVVMVAIQQKSNLEIPSCPPCTSTRAQGLCSIHQTPHCHRRPAIAATPPCSRNGTRGRTFSSSECIW